MKDPQEYIEEFSRDGDHWADQDFDEYNITALINEVRKEAWNAALEHVSKLAITSKTIYNTEKDQDEWDGDSLWCNKHEILTHKLK